MYFDSTLLENYELAVFVKIILAAAAGAIIGLEREVHGRPAGLRTHLLVAAGACLMMIVSEAFFLKYGDLPGTGVVRLDPSRVAAQIVTGIGFLGAGVIIKEGLIVRGLTTAASLWMVAGIGMAYGMGMLSVGSIGTAVSLFSLLVLKRLEPRIKKNRYLHLTVTARAVPDVYPQLEQVFSENNLRMTDIEADLDIEKNQIVYRMVLTQHRARIGREMSKIISGIDGVQKILYK
jgi:putative Mg2+ transporter-C (MgtC) family protein